MGSCPDRLSAIQRDLLEGFFEVDLGFFLTGGSALAGYYLGHRESKDLDLFVATADDQALDAAERRVVAVAEKLGARAERLRHEPDFRQFLVRRGSETTAVDLVRDRAPQLVADKPQRGRVRIDALRDLVANKLSTVLGRSEIRDLVDLCALLQHRPSLDEHVRDAIAKDAGADAATLAWVLSQIELRGAGPVAGTTVTYDQLRDFLRWLVAALRRLAFPAPAGKP